MQEAEDLVAEATSPDRTRKLVEVFDQLSDCLCRVADMVSKITVDLPQADDFESGLQSGQNLNSCVQVSSPEKIRWVGRDFFFFFF